MTLATLRVSGKYNAAGTRPQESHYIVLGPRKADLFTKNDTVQRIYGINQLRCTTNKSLGIP